MQIKGKRTFILYEREDFSISTFKLEEPVTLPNGSEVKTITGKGYMVPDRKTKLLLTGDFEPYKDGYTFNIEDVEEIVENDEHEIKEYLCTLKGVGKATAEKMYQLFGFTIFDIIELSPELLKSINGISDKKVEKIHSSYVVRKGAHKLFLAVHRYGVSANQCAKVYETLGPYAYEIVMKDPYIMMGIKGISFSLVDKIANSIGIPNDSPSRIKAGILEVLLEGERGGGSAINKLTPVPPFIFGNFLRPELRKLINDDNTYVSGSTYLPRNICYVLLLKLLGNPVTEQDFDRYCVELHTSEKIYVSVDKKKPEADLEKIKIYRRWTAVSEISAAKNIRHMLDSPMEELTDLLTTISEEEAKQDILLSDEQNGAVKMALNNHISIITGGPGTGKTSVQRTIINTFKRYYPNGNILLAAPTGRAAKRMAEASGLPACTLHSALGIYDEHTPPSDEKSLEYYDLIIVDETSMIGANLFASLMRNVNPKNRLVLIGDVDQLPSVEVGAVLRELINSKKVPTTRLTKTYRQSSGSSIVTNAARIKVGEKGLEQNQDFNLIIMDTSEHIQEIVCSKIPSLVKEYGEEEVLCLTSFRKRTTTGANALNEALRNVLRKDIDENTPFFTKGEIKIYVGDKVMNTKNTRELTNGDIGKVLSIKKDKDELFVTCSFDDKVVTLEDEETNNLDLAYATTVHKSQGSEAKCVVLVCDMAHKIMLKRNLFYTGVTRAKQMIYIIAQPQAVPYAIETQDSVYRRSQLGKLI